MKPAYVDSSFLLAIAFGEPDATRLAARLGQYDSVHASDLVEAEVLSALAREAARPPDADVFAALNCTFPDRPLTEEFGRILEEGYLKGADLWHLACALYLSPDPRDLFFLTLDTRQKKIAARLGFRL